MQLGSFEIPWEHLAGVNDRLTMGRNRLVLSPAYRSAKELVWAHALTVSRVVPENSSPLVDRAIQVTIFIHPPKKKRGRAADIDAFIKVILDGMQGTFYEDDSQVVTLAVQKADPFPDRGCVRVIVNELLP